MHALQYVPPSVREQQIQFLEKHPVNIIQIKVATQNNSRCCQFVTTRTSKGGEEVMHHRHRQHRHRQHRQRQHRQREFLRVSLGRRQRHMQQNAQQRQKDVGKKQKHSV